MSEAAIGPTSSRPRRSLLRWPLLLPISSPEFFDYESVRVTMEGPATQGNGYSRKTVASHSPRSREQSIERARILWEHRGILFRAFLLGGVLSAAIAFSLPKSYEATAKLMPPESSSSGGAALLAALSTRGGSGMLGSLAGDLLGVKGNGAVIVEILGSRTVADRLIDQFQLAH